MDKKLGEKLGDWKNFSTFFGENVVGVPKNEIRRSTGASLDFTFSCKDLPFLIRFRTWSGNFPHSQQFISSFFSEPVLCNQRNALSKSVIFWKSFQSYFTSFGKLTRSFFHFLSKIHCRWSNLHSTCLEEHSDKRNLWKATSKKLHGLETFELLAKNFVGFSKRQSSLSDEQLAGKFFSGNFIFTFVSGLGGWKFAFFEQNPSKSSKFVPDNNPRKAFLWRRNFEKKWILSDNFLDFRPKVSSGLSKSPSICQQRRL